MTREWLDVPYSEKDQAKVLGARWDQAAKRWYAPRPGMAPPARWAALPDLPALLPGEDRSFGPGLFVDLVPSSCWFTNARSCMAGRDWERVRRLVVGRAGRRCEVPGCGAQEARAREIWLEVHERWEYLTGPSGRVQVLRRLVCLCTWCPHGDSFWVRRCPRRGPGSLRAPAHRDRHDRGGRPRHIDAAFALWRQRSAAAWDLDLSILTAAGVSLARPADAGATRAQTAGRELYRARKAKTSPVPAKQTGWPWVNMQGHLDEPRPAQG
jgi:hypothetical protein